MLRCFRLTRGKKDFDAWAYRFVWPRIHTDHDGSPVSPSLSLSLVMEDIKFAYNAWCFLRLALFLGTPPPKVVGSLARTTPTMDARARGNHIFHRHVECRYDLRRSEVYKVALVPCGERARSIHEFDWSPPRRVELVVGHENGMSDEVLALCDDAVFIPQYGSIGSLSVISAVAIAAHCALCRFPPPASAHCRRAMASVAEGPVCKGHMPESRNSVAVASSSCRPHEASLLALSNDAIRNILADRRRGYALQISLVVYNELGDRNIGALMRTANAFNCERMVILHRRRFNRRGALGTQHLLDTVYAAGTDSAEFLSAINGYVLWILYPYYPYLRMYDVADGCASQPHVARSARDDGERVGKKSALVVEDDGDKDEAYIAADDVRLAAWRRTKHELSRNHALVQRHPHLCGSEIYLDEGYGGTGVQEALDEVRRGGHRGVMLIVPEEGASVHPALASLARKTIFLTHPSRLSCETQRGLNPALSGAIALHRLRSAIDQVV